MALKRTNLEERYELREILGRGGMGVVYRALDRVMNREVALKTILDVENPATAQLFYKEWSILATMVHPNVINIYDIGEFDQDGVKKPFFVMPLLPGVTLDRLIKDGSPRLSVAGVLEIITQAAHGLHAAHEQGLVHRDVKPSNIFVMDDNSVKIIDFGIARQASVNSQTSVKGTLFYIAPEQLQSKPSTPLSDVFALGVVTYEAFTRLRPFRGASESDIVEAILHHNPPPLSEINRDVSFSISQVVHKAMAKQPWHRFFNMREYADALHKAVRNEPLEYFDSTKIKPRLERAARSFEAGDYVFASEVLSELEAEGHLDQNVALLRGRVDQAVRQTRIRQTLESARRFVEATEYPLALRKIQEALELDPNDADALSLKAQVEKERREKKISEWIALARQHLDNQAFRQAREALENVVQIKPNETEALGLLAEIGRRESEVTRIREQKANLYQAAQQAWEKGEVTSALSKLEVLVAMDRELPESDTGRSSTYQNFYNQVHSEHNSLKSNYEEAKRHLGADNFEGAMAICKQYLAKYPNHALFQALKFDVEERQRQKLSLMVAETDRRVDQEPDLDRRVAILDEALKSYPGESHFEGALRLVRDKRDLVNSIVAKARFFEEKGQFNDALDQWQILKSIHDKQPGLPFEIQRLIKRRDQQAHESSKARWVEQIDKYLEGGDYKRALQTVSNALTEFPGEPELQELEKLVRKSEERGVQALDRLIQARELSEKGEHDAALATLREAQGLDPRNTVIRTVLVNSLMEQARRIAENDSESAQRLVQEVLSLEPNHAGAQSLSSGIGDRKRDDYIAWCLAQARRLQTEGDLEGAIAVVGQGLNSHPNEPRLQQLQATLQRALAEKDRQSAPGAVQTQRAGTSPDFDAPPVVEAASTSLLQEDLRAAVTQPLVRPSPPQGPLPPPAASPVPPFGPAAAAAAAPAVTPLPPVPPVVRVTRPPIAGGTRKLLIGTGIAAVLVVGGALVATSLHKKKIVAPPPVASAKYQVSLHSAPAGAEIKVNGTACGTSTCSLELAPGTYPAEAQLTGYLSASTSINIGPSTSRDITLTLNPLPPRVAIFTDLQNGAVGLDGSPSGQIQDGGAEIPNLTPGPHTLTVQGGDSTVSIPVEIVAGGPPKLSAPIDAKNLRAFLVAGYGSDARVYASGTGYKATLDGNPAGDLAADGLALQGLAPGTHTLDLTGQTGQHDKIAFESQPSATLYVSLGASQNLGTLTIRSNEDQAQVFINGKKYRRDTKLGQLIVNLAPRTYTIQLQKDGYAPTPEQTIDIKRGADAKLSFTLQVAKATLTIHRAPPGTDIFVDGVHVGSANAGGDFQISTIDPGRHNVTLRNEKYKPLSSEQIFLSVKAVELTGLMEPIVTTGTLHAEVTPAGIDAHLRFRRDGDSQDHEMSGSSANVPEGHYTVSASAPGYVTTNTSVTITAGGTATATLPMHKAETKAPPKTPAPTGFGIDEWVKTGGWTQQQNMIVHTGGNYVIAPLEFSQGTVRFSALLMKGKRLEWVVGFQGDKDYFYYQLDDKNLTRYQQSHGSKSGQVRAPHGLDHKAAMNVNIAVTPKSIVVSVLRGGQWVTIDSWDLAGSQVNGKFGFHIPGNDQIGLQEFRITPN